jgi:hypothetical protein
MAGSEIDRLAPASPAADDTELSDVLDRAVAKLSPADRTAVIMRFLDGRSSEDIAAALHLTPEAARKRVERAVVKLQEILSRFGVTTAAPGADRIPCISRDRDLAAAGRRIRPGNHRSRIGRNRLESPPPARAAPALLQKELSWR